MLQIQPHTHTHTNFCVISWYSFAPTLTHSLSPSLLLSLPSPPPVYDTHMQTRASAHTHTLTLYYWGSRRGKIAPFLRRNGMPCMLRCKQILHHGDQILAVDGRWNLTLDAVIDALKGDHIPGTSVTVTVSKAKTVPKHSRMCVSLPPAHSHASKCAVCVLYVRGRGNVSK